MRVFGIEFRRGTRGNVSKVEPKKISKSGIAVSDVVDAIVSLEEQIIISPPLKELVPNQIYLNHKAKISQLNNTSIPTTLRRPVNNGKRSASAGFTSTSEKEKPGVKFDDLLKNRAEGVKAQRLLVQNTAKNQLPLPSPPADKPRVTRSTPASAQIRDINAKWQSMMTADEESRTGKKNNRNISFNEKVTCHKIPRIKDIIEEYDAFEREFLAECKSRIADLTASYNEGRSGSTTALSSRAASDASDDDEEQYLRLAKSSETQLTVDFEMSLEDILETQVTIPISLSRQDDIFCESRMGKNRSQLDQGSITSLGPACPTPDRSISPASAQDSPAAALSVEDHISELESLFDVADILYTPAHQTIAVPVISLQMYDSQSTLLDATEEVKLASPHPPALPSKKTGFWSSVFTKLSSLFSSNSTSKVHPVEIKT